MEVNQVQIFEKGYNNRCSTFSCSNRATKYIGRPDAPLNVAYILCDKCIGELIQSVDEISAKTPSPYALTLAEMLNDEAYRQEIAQNEQIRQLVLSTVDLTPTETSINESESIINTAEDEELLTEEMIHAVRTHGDIDKLIFDYELDGVPTKAEGATVSERKDAIMKLLFKTETE